MNTEEISAFNRNSDPKSIYVALKKYASSVQHPIVILNSVKIFSQELLSSLPSNVIFFSEFSSLEPDAYIHLISHSACFMTGPSGALYVANLFDIPTLVFDFPPFFHSTGSFFCFYHRSQFTSVGSALTNLPDPYMLPHNGILLHHMSISISHLNSYQLFVSLLSFSSVIEQYHHYERINPKRCIVDYIIENLPINSFIFHSRSNEA